MDAISIKPFKRASCAPFKRRRKGLRQSPRQDAAGVRGACPPERTRRPLRRHRRHRSKGLEDSAKPPSQNRSRTKFADGRGRYGAYGAGAVQSPERITLRRPARRRRPGRCHTPRAGPLRVLIVDDEPAIVLARAWKARAISSLPRAMRAPRSTWSAEAPQISLFSTSVCRTWMVSTSSSA
jgi:hypothetical protein